MSNTTTRLVMQAERRRREQGRPKDSPIASAREQGHRYYLGTCIDCEQPQWSHRQRPRIPLCRYCTRQREANARKEREYQHELTEIRRDRRKYQS